jgi:glycogen debranching enzyme
MGDDMRIALRDMGLRSIRALETEQGILASGRDEVYGCIFGRDSCIVALKLMRAYEKEKNEYFLALVRKIVWNLGELQGETVNIESGEEPGKIIHEFRPSGHEHLTVQKEGGEAAWYLYPDRVMRNFDSVDSTALFLMAAHAYVAVSGDDAYAAQIEPRVKAALSWVLEYGDSNGDGLIDYSFHPERTYGGLKTQSWMDSAESVFFEHSDERPVYPIAPVEAQAYAYAALRSWSAYFAAHDESEYASELTARADALKVAFNRAFVLKTRTRTSLAYAIGGKGRKLTSARSSIGHCLFAAVRRDDGTCDSIVNEEDVPQLVERLLAPDLFVKSAGIRTLSSRSRHFDPGSYHNGSIWPHDTIIAAQGLEQFGYVQEAALVRRAIVRAYLHFETPIELFQYANRRFAHYEGPDGQGACKLQAWSAAGLLSML